jgi:hypothetical protein
MRPEAATNACLARSHVGFEEDLIGDLANARGLKLLLMHEALSCARGLKLLLMHAALSQASKTI